MRRRIKVATIVIGCILTAWLIWVILDSRAIPKTVDLARCVIGDRPVLAMENDFYGVKNRVDEKRYAARVKAGKAKAHQLVKVDPLPATNSKTVLSDIKLETNSSEADDGKWINKGWYFRTKVHPEPKLDSVVDVVLIDLAQADLHLMCGTSEPAKGAGKIPADQLERTLMAFSGGFQHKHDLCGMAQTGKVLQPMKCGAGTLIVYADGSVKIGKWSRDWTAVTPIMSDVRQCLLLVDQGKYNSDGAFNIFAVGNETYVFRSAVGLTKDRTKLLYAAGNNISAAGLAKALIAAGASEAIHLDMNYGNATCGVFVQDKGKLRIVPLTTRFPCPSRFAGSNSRDFMYLVKKEP